jgi:RNA polymerase sigma-70 factor (ECF subfamily)
MTSIEGGSLALPTAMSVGSEIDLAGLAESYSALLFRVAHSILRSQSESEDVVQDVFVRVIEHRRKLPEVRDMRVWLVRIAWNLALDRKRRIRPEQFDEYFAESLAAKDLPADRALAEAREMQVVLREIDRLPKMERSALLLSAVDELQTPEIAAVLGKSESAVRALIFRARTRLRERIQKGAGCDRRG